MLVSVNYASRGYQPPRVAGVSLNGKRAGVAVIPYLGELFNLVGLETADSLGHRRPWLTARPRNIEQCFI